MTAAEAEDFAGELARKMSDFGASQIVITGIPCGDGIGTYGLDVTKETDGAFFHRAVRQPKSFPGTGDIFASVLLGALMRGDDLYTATRVAADFVGEVIAYSQNCGEPTRDGVLLEPLLGKLAKGV